MAGKPKAKKKYELLLTKQRLLQRRIELLETANDNTKDSLSSVYRRIGRMQQDVDRLQRAFDALGKDRLPVGLETRMEVVEGYLRHLEVRLKAASI